MLGEKQFKPKLFYSVQIDQFVPTDHELRRILGQVDFGFIRGQVKDKYSPVGQPSVDPVVILKMLFLGYYYGILSERQLVKRIQTDLAFRWFLGYDLDENVPTHSVLSKARGRYGVEVFQSFFDRIVEQCTQAGLVEGKQAFLDATLIEANAAKGSLVPRMKVLSPAEYTEEMLKEPALAGSSGPRDPKGKGTVHERMVSQTDPDASFRSGNVKKSGLYYEGHYLIDGKARVITAATASPTADSTAQHAPALLMRSRFRHRLSFKSFCADAEYGTQGLYHFLFQEGITPFIPSQGPKATDSPFSKDKFLYDAQEDVYRCPEGHELERKDEDPGKQRTIYRPAIAGTCASCPWKSQCAPGKKDRRVGRLWYQEAVDQAKQLTTTLDYRRQMRLRKTLLEPLFGEAKELHGLRRARYRRLFRVKIQVLWTATVLNIKRLIQSSGPKKGHESSFSLNSYLASWFATTWSVLTSIFNCQRTWGLNPTF